MENDKASSSSDGRGELQCIGTLEIVSPKPVGFLCGSIPVPTDKSFHAFNSAIVPSTQTLRAPRYQMIPTETDLNMPPFLPNIPEKVLPVAVPQPRSGGGLPYESGSIASNLSRKGEALAVSGLAEYGDEIDVIAPADILKQIFKIPYSRARLSIAVHRIGQTLVLNAGPDVEEGEKLIRRHNQSQCADKSLFLNFAMHSVRMEACDCPTAHNATSDEQSNSSVLPGRFESREMSFESSEHPEYPQVKHDSFVWRSNKKDKRNKGHDAIKKVSQVKEKPRSSMQESEKYRRVSNDGFLRVLFWQFQKFRVLLGSDLLIFSNEKYVSVSLHLWDVSRQVTPLTWLEAWLDNVMASVPELAICYHQDGVVQGYELLKTNEIFLSKGISEDGNPAFHPHVVQQNGLSVLRFLEENCKQDPGAYWLYKSAGEDVIQLFDMSVLPKNHSSNDGDDNSNSVPSLVHRGRSDSLLSLGTLLYRIAHRLSLSMAPNNRARCARFFKKCLDFLDEPDHLVVRASAHEQFARFLLTYGEELDLTSEVLPVESEATVADAEDESFVIFTGSSDSIVHQLIYSLPSEDEPSKDEETYQDSVSEASRTLIESGERDERDSSDMVVEPSSSDQSFAVCEMTPVVQTVVDPIASKLAAIRHISQAIKSLRWKRQLQTTEPELDHAGKTQDRQPVPMDFSVCACGDADCIEICDIWEWLPTSKLDDKLWKLVLLLGESYLALGQAYKDSDQLHQTLKVVELASLVYGSMPQHLKDTRFISSMACNSSSEMEVNVDVDCLTFDQFSSTYLFWAKAWTLVGDVYVEFHMIKAKEIPIQIEKKPFSRELRMSSSVLKEVERLKKKLGPFNQNCSSCSLVNCSCQSDRASSGSSASSSRDVCPLGYSRKHSKKSYAKRISRIENHEDVLVHHKEEDGNGSESLQMETHDAVFTEAENDSREKKVKNGGIFKYIQGPVIGDVDYNLSAALSCYEEARKALGGYPTGSTELQSVVKKKGWVWNEMGRIALERKELDKAEVAFVEAVKSFKEVLDHANIILINCNLGHGRRAVAEEMVSKMESLKKHTIFHNSYNKALETAKLEYGESLRYYGAARTELNSIAEEEPESVSSSLRNEAFTQFAHTYLRLGMLLARENATAEVYGVVEDWTSPGIRGAKKGLRKHEISANDAIREALSVYESLGELRKQEAAYAYFQLACYQRDCCLKFLESDQKKNSMSKGENIVFQRVKQYASLADKNWQKSIDFYGPKTHPVMYLTILIERSALSVILSSSFHSNAMLESALTLLLEGRHVSEETIPDPLMNDDSKIYDKFWTHLQTLLKRMLAATISTNTNKSLAGSQQTPSNKSGDVGKLKELYRIALKSTPDFTQLHALHSLWIS